MNTPIRSGDYVDAIRTIGALNEKIGKLQTLVGDWTLNAEVSVHKQDNGFQIKAVFKKPNGKGFIETISLEDVKYYANDQEGLIAMLVQKIFDLLYRQQIRDEITPLLTRSINNASLLSNK